MALRPYNNHPGFTLTDIIPAIAEIMSVQKESLGRALKTDELGLLTHCRNEGGTLNIALAVHVRHARLQRSLDLRMHVLNRARADLEAILQGPQEGTNMIPQLSS